MNRIYDLEQKYLKKKVPEFHVGDTVRVHLKVVEGERERTQIFQGTVIRRRGRSTGETFTVRRVSFGEGVERIFPLHSPLVLDIEVVAHGKTRRAKLYYLRDRIGKATRVKVRGYATKALESKKAEATPEETPPEVDSAESDSAAASELESESSAQPAESASEESEPQMNTDEHG